MAVSGSATQPLAGPAGVCGGTQTDAFDDVTPLRRALDAAEAETRRWRGQCERLLSAPAPSVDRASRAEAAEAKGRIVALELERDQLRSALADSRLSERQLQERLRAAEDCAASLRAERIVADTRCASLEAESTRLRDMSSGSSAELRGARAERQEAQRRAAAAEAALSAAQATMRARDEELSSLRRQLAEDTAGVTGASVALALRERHLATREVALQSAEMQVSQGRADLQHAAVCQQRSTEEALEAIRRASEGAASQHRAAAGAEAFAFGQMLAAACERASARVGLVERARVSAFAAADRDRVSAAVAMLRQAFLAASSVHGRVAILKQAWTEHEQLRSTLQAPISEDIGARRLLNELAGAATAELDAILAAASGDAESASALAAAGYEGRWPLPVVEEPPEETQGSHGSDLEIPASPPPMGFPLLQ